MRAGARVVCARELVGMLRRDDCHVGGFVAGVGMKAGTAWRERMGLGLAVVCELALGSCKADGHAGLLGRKRPFGLLGSHAAGLC